MVQPLSLKLAAISALAALAIATPAQACRVLVAPDQYWTEAKDDGSAFAIARVTAIRPHTAAELADLHGRSITAPGGTGRISDNSGHVDLRLVRLLSGKAPSTFSSVYDAGPSCGLNWSPKVGESVLVIVGKSGWVQVWPFLAGQVSEN